MARTAPVPNIPPIPGMCPSIAVMGGGAGGGGGSGDGAGDGDGNGPGDGSGNGDNADGDGRGAGSCGTGGTGACTNCGHNVSRGDPVDVVTGVVQTLPHVDLELYGFTNFQFARTYSSVARKRDVGLGFGWAHSMAWRLTVRRDRIQISRPTGQLVEFPLLTAAGETCMSRGGWILRREPDGYSLDAMDQFRHVFSQTQDNLEYALSYVEDRPGNRIVCRYAGTALAEIVDTAGRVIRLAPDSAGRATELSVFDDQAKRWATFARYSYDDAGDLIAVADPVGSTHHYAYESHRLVSHTDPEGLTFYFVYGKDGKCVETWGDYANGTDLGLAASVTPFLADGTTRAKGVLHCVFEWGESGYSEVMDSVGVQRFFGNAFGTIDKAVSNGAATSHVHNENGHVIRHVDALGATTLLERDERGRLLRETNALGQSMTIRRNDSGDVIEMVNALGQRTLAEYDYYGNLVRHQDAKGATTLFEWQRGVMTAKVDARSARTTFKVNAQGLLEELTQPNGGVWRYAYNGLGFCTKVTDPTGAVTTYGYDAAWRIASIEDSNGVTYHQYNRNHKLTKLIHPNGAWSEFTWGGFRSLLAVTKSSGETIGYRYNREGWLLEVRNAKNETHALEWNNRKDLVGETTFDGRKLRFRYDLMNRVIGADLGVGKWTEMVRDPLGQVIEQKYPDGFALAIEYDAVGRIASAKCPASEVMLTRDENGEVVRETQVVAGRSFVVERQLDLGRQVEAVSTSLGHALRVRRDRWGSVVERTIDAREVLSEVDVLGREVRRHLPEGGCVETQYEPTGILARKTVIGPERGGPRTEGQPDWVGELQTNATYDRRYRYNQLGDMLGYSDLSRGDRVFDVDAAGRVVKVEGPAGVLETFSYDPLGNLQQGGPKAVDREYGPGGRLERAGDVDYEWDRAGRLVAKKPADPKAERETLAWEARGLLREVSYASGKRVDFAYDVFARRIRKRVFEKSPAGKEKLVKTVIFVWEGSRLIEELHFAPGRPEWRRTFVHDDDGTPIAHREATVGAEAEASYVHYVTDAIDAPTVLVDGAGRIASKLTQTLYGQSLEPRATPFLFPGQYVDDETGLANNHCRYYDPEDGRYISADPVGLLGGLNPFAYVPNPLTFADPLGLRARRPPHEVGRVSLEFDGGPTVQPGGAHASHASPRDGQPTNFYSGYRADDRYPGREDAHCDGLTSGSAYWESHTERKSMRWAEEEAARTGNSLDGAHLRMTGRQAPCATCNAEMERWTREPEDGTGASVTYNWPTNQSRHYSGGASTGHVRHPYVSS